MFQFPPCPPTGLYIQPVVPEYCSGGFPHSGIFGSKLDDSSPKLIAAIHALHRLLAPRHPPHALSSLIHVRRQHLIRVDSSYIFRSVVKVPPAYAGQRTHRHDVSLTGAPESRSGPPASHPSTSVYKAQNRPAYHRAYAT